MARTGRQVSPDPTKYRGDHRKFQWVVPVESIIGKVPLVPVGDTGTVPHGMGARFPGAYGDSRPGTYVNSWALGWSRDI